MAGRTNDEAKGQRRLGRGMMVAFWLVLLALGTWWFQAALQHRYNPNADLARSAGVDGSPVVLERNASGHFVATGRIDGQPVEFLLDTGATYVSVPAGLADSLGLQRGASVRFHTANGTARGYLTRIDEISLGSLAARSVRGSINPGMGGETVLLGMSFLGRFDIELSGSRMTLRAPSG